MPNLLKIKNSKLSSTQIKNLLVFFIAETSVRMAADLIGINRNSATKFYDFLRKIIVKNLEKESPFFDGEIEVDESYFGGIRKGKRGRGSGGKIPV